MFGSVEGNGRVTYYNLPEHENKSIKGEYQAFQGCVNDDLDFN